ncbi:hypothetical protein RJ640_023318 [Escallonia rubra]|uniref:Uncharacterized protein n=1 Tax=Escallonia rubra TaxID=112253 RepID=A0AA88R2J7_9ASTE|nr:hypothetical protein RJ640_023318 [Escallonia rubra]
MTSGISPSNLLLDRSTVAKTVAKPVRNMAFETVLVNSKLWKLTGEIIVALQYKFLQFGEVENAIG